MSEQRLIDANALIQKRYQVKQLLDQPDMFVIGQGFVMDAPTIEPKRGEWTVSIREEWAGDGCVKVMTCRCSVCGVRAYEYKTNFCPHCGADMRNIKE